MTLSLEYLDAYYQVTRHGTVDPVWDWGGYLEALTKRRDLVDAYSWAVPNEQALELLGDHAPIFEMGAGTGYWAYEMRRRGIPVEAYDKYPPHRRHNHYHDKAKKVWTGVLHGRPPKAKRRPRHTLFLSWPPYASPMAYDTLRAYQGDTLIYIGEGDGGCTGCHQFHRLLDTKWNELEWISLPKWQGLHDDMRIYRRKGS